MQSLREHPHRVDGQQGGHQGQEGQGQVHCLPPQEEPSGETSDGIPNDNPDTKYFSIMTSLPSRTTTLRSHSCGLPG